MERSDNYEVDITLNEVPKVDDPAEQKRLEEQNRRDLQAAIDAEAHAHGDDFKKSDK